MPITEKGKKMKAAMKEHYGEEKGEHVFYATENKGKVKGMVKKKAAPSPSKKSRKRKKSDGSVGRAIAGR